MIQLVSLQDAVTNRRKVIWGEKNIQLGIKYYLKDNLLMAKGKISTFSRISGSHHLNQVIKHSLVNSAASLLLELPDEMQYKNIIETILVKKV